MRQGESMPPDYLVKKRTIFKLLTSQVSFTGIRVREQGQSAGLEKGPLSHAY